MLQVGRLDLARSRSAARAQLADRPAVDVEADAPAQPARAKARPPTGQADIAQPDHRNVYGWCDARCPSAPISSWFIAPHRPAGARARRRMERGDAGGRCRPFARRRAMPRLASDGQTPQSASRAFATPDTTRAPSPPVPRFFSSSAGSRISAGAACILGPARDQRLGNSAASRLRSCLQAGSLLAVVVSPRSRMASGRPALARRPQPPTAQPALLDRRRRCASA